MGEVSIILDNEIIGTWMDIAFCPQEELHINQMTNLYRSRFLYV